MEPKLWRYLGWGLGVAILLALGVVIAACEGPAGPPGPSGSVAEITCSQCHNDTTLVFSKGHQWEDSVHATGGAYVRAASASCAGCHSSEGFAAAIASMTPMNKIADGIVNPSPVNCRTCHLIHNTYTSSDWALRTTEPVTMITSGSTYDQGDGNLCANCHQPRTAPPDASAATFEVTSTHWGPHHGPQSSALLGEGAYDVSNMQSPHYMVVRNGCPTCHVASGSHTFEPSVSACKSCHADASNFDIDGAQTELDDMAAQLASKLEAKGMLEDGHPVLGTYPTDEAGALWNYLYFEEDRSHGAHNAPYLKAVLQKGLDLMQ